MLIWWSQVILLGVAVVAIIVIGWVCCLEYWFGED